MLCRAPTGSRLSRTGRLHEATAVDQTPKILFVQADSGQSLNSSLQLQQCKAFGNQLEYDRPIGQLAAQARDGRRQHAAMVARHLLAEDRSVIVLAVSGENRGPPALGHGVG